MLALDPEFDNQIQSGVKANVVPKFNDLFGSDGTRNNENLSNQIGETVAKGVQVGLLIVVFIGKKNF